MKTLIFFFLAAVLISCNHFEFSPDQSFDRISLRNVNARNLKKLGDGATDDTVKFVLTGDSQKSRDETVKFCKAVNAIQGIDFVVLAGDITEFGILKEMLWISRTLEDLRPPYVAVIGNHDETGRGKAAFLNMFGTLNYSFVYGGIKFVCHDSNSREYNFNGEVPNISWLKNELKSSREVTGFIGISHVPVNSEDFDNSLKADYLHTFAQTSGFLASLSAHTHNYELFYPDNSGIPYIITSAMANSEFLIVQIVKNKLSFERIYF